MTAAETNHAENLPRTEVDLEAELESLRDYVSAGWRPMNHRLWVNVEEFEVRIEQIIALLPKEIRRARRIIKEEQRILQDARDEARRLLEEARAEAEQMGVEARSQAEQTVKSSQEEAARLVESSAIRQRALEQAEATLARAEETASAVRQQSYDYAGQVVDNVVTSLNRLIETIHRDRAQLEELRPDES